MSRAPFIPFDVCEYLANTMHLTTEENGAYLLLIIRCWTAGSIPDDDKRLAVIAKMGIKKWRGMRQTLAEFFTISNDEWKCNMAFKLRSKRKAIPEILRRSVFDRDGYECVYCGDIDGPFHLDHIFPKSKGGSDDLENLTVSCAPCNRSKSDKLLEDWIQ